MATTTERLQAVEERTDDLEAVLARLMDHTARIMERMESEGARHRQEAARDRQAIREEGERDRRAIREQMDRTQQEGERDRQAMRERVDRAEQEGERARQSMRERMDQVEQEGERDRQAMRERMDQAEQEGERDRQAMREEGERSRRAMMREINKSRGDMANKLGTVVEDFVAPSIPRLAREVLGCGDQVSFAVRIYRYRDNDRGREREFDALYVGTRAVLLNETKSTALNVYCREFVEFLRDDEFVRYFPELKGKPIVPVFSSLSIPENIATYLTRRGVYAVAMGDEAMQVINLEAMRRLNVP